MSSSASRSAYSGNRRKIVLAFDVGTTYSGISYSILDPGQCPSIHAVTKFPSQEIIAGASKVPSIIYYDKKGCVKAIGAEAIKDDVYEGAIEGEWYKAEWFKLHLRSKYTTEDIDIGHHVPPLPPNKTVVDVFADYLRYLLDCATSYIIQVNQPNGDDLWASVEDDIHFVLSHPNGWEGKEQNQMRKAAVQAGLVPDDLSGHSRISFVTEGEASLHFAIENCILSQMVEDQGMVIVDGGGGTIDISTYKCTSSKTSKARFEEIAIPQCHFQGSVFVTFRAKDFLEDLLVESPFADDLDLICDCFDKRTKTRFRDASEPQYIKFGSTKENDPSCGIRFGQLKLVGTDVAKFFQPSIDCIVQSVMISKRSTHREISHVILVGGFAANDFLFEQVKAQLSKAGLVLVRPETRVNKAVSDGAISFYLDHYVRTRVAKVFYGTKISPTYNERDPEHVKRSASKFISLDGETCLRGKFDVIVPKNTQVSETKEFSCHYFWDSATADAFQHTRESVMCYRGLQDNPKWIDTDPTNFTTVCTLEADLSQIPTTARRGLNGKTYYTITYDMILIFGLTELQAQVRWFVKGVEHRSSAQMIYDDD